MLPHLRSWPATQAEEKPSHSHHLLGSAHQPPEKPFILFNFIILIPPPHPCCYPSHPHPRQDFPHSYHPCHLVIFVVIVPISMIVIVTILIIVILIVFILDSCNFFSNRFLSEFTAAFVILRRDDICSENLSIRQILFSHRPRSFTKTFLLPFLAFLHSQPT